ncbi:MAG: hypothetical protein Q9174_002431 [Haloplaca sp. 1 TL-2023]
MVIDERMLAIVAHVSDMQGHQVQPRKRPGPSKLPAGSSEAYISCQHSNPGFRMQAMNGRRSARCHPPPGFVMTETIQNLIVTMLVEGNAAYVRSIRQQLPALRVVSIVDARSSHEAIKEWHALRLISHSSIQDQTTSKTKEVQSQSHLQNFSLKAATMHITVLATTVLAAIPSISALNYRAYSSTNSCSGSAFGCSDGGAVCCGGWPSAYGYSAQFDNLGDGTQCWKSGGSGRITNANWFRSASKRVKPRAELAPPSDANCSPSFFAYTDDEGVSREIKVEDAEHAKVIAEQYEKGDMAALAEVESHVQ